MITINLLPENLKENINFAKKNKVVLGIVKITMILSLFILASFIICGISLFNSNQFFLSQVDESAKIINKYKPTVDKQKKIEAKAKSVEKVMSGYKYWSKFSLYFYDSVPEGMYLSFLNTSDNNLNISGFSKTKKDIGIFRDTLENMDGFTNINIESIKEIEDPAKEDVILNSFNITGKIEKESMTKGVKK